MSTELVPATDPLTAPPAADTQLQRPIITLLLCTGCVFLFLAIASAVPEPSWDALARWGYPSAERIWDGAYWGVLSSVFVHLAVWHVAFNVYWLWRLGVAVERTVGPFKLLAFVLGAAVVSSGIQLGVSGETGYGASGVVYALFGLLWVGRNRVPAFAHALADKTVALFLVWLVVCIVASQIGAMEVGNAAHVSGLALGALVGQWVVLDRHRALARWATVVLVVGSLVPLFWNPWSSRWVGYRAYKAHTAGRYDDATAGYRRSIALGGDRVWALQNLALAHYAKGAMQDYSTTLAELRTVKPSAADEVEREIASRRETSETSPPADPD